MQMLHRTGADFDEKAALDDLIGKFGIDETKEIAASSSPSKKKRKSEGGDGDAKSPDISAKKVKKTEIVTVEQNRAAAEAIKEMADIFFKQKDMRKGGDGRTHLRTHVY